MVADVLRREGFQVFEAASLDEAIGILESVADIDVVIADMHMRTARDGIALADYVRAHCPGVPLVLASGQIPSTLEGGTFDAFFPKPYRPEDIVAWIKRRLAGFGTRAP
jgi:CheY-like chemotaxis protein